MRTISRIGISTAAGIALVLWCGSIAANAATPTPGPQSTASTCSVGQHLVSAWKAAPAELRADLAKAKAEKPGTARRADLRSIRDRALAGDYGAGVEAKAEWLTAHRGERLRPFPASLKADLKTLHSDPRSKKAAEAEVIAGKALAGDYGTTIQSFAKSIQSSPAWTACEAGS